MVGGNEPTHCRVQEKNTRVDSGRTNGSFGARVPRGDLFNRGYSEGPRVAYGEAKLGDDAIGLQSYSARRTKPMQVVDNWAIAL